MIAARGPKGAKRCGGPGAKGWRRGKGGPAAGRGRRRLAPLDNGAAKPRGDGQPPCPDPAPATPVTEWQAPLRELERRLAPQQPDRLVVGLTGGIGSGKTVATDELQRLGAGVVDADLAARLVVQPGRPALREIAERYGGRILLDDGSLDRRALREIVFADEAERSWLNGVTHPRIGEEIRAQLQGHRGEYGVLVSPLLFETGQAGALPPDRGGARAHEQPAALGGTARRHHRGGHPDDRRHPDVGHRPAGAHRPEPAQRR